MKGARAVRTVVPGALRLCEPGALLRCLVIAPGPAEWAAVDLDSGAIVRARPGAGDAWDPSAGVGASDAWDPSAGGAWGRNSGAGASSGADAGVGDGPGANAFEFGAQVGPKTRTRRHRAGASRGRRAQNGTPLAPAPAPAPALVPAQRVLDVVEVVLAEDPEPPDPARPEAVALAGPPAPAGRLRSHHARRLLASLVAGENVRPLLGAVGPAVPYADLDGSLPSIAVIEPSRGPEVVAVEGAVWGSFGLRGAEERLPVVDPRTVAVASLSPGTVMTRSGVASMLGYDPRYLVIALVPPVGGHARKAVIGVLPRG